MRAFVLHEHGPIETYKLETAWPEPKPEPGQAVVRVRACGLNYLDVFVRRGMPGCRCTCAASPAATSPAR